MVRWWLAPLVFRSLLVHTFSNKKSYLNGKCHLQMIHVFRFFLMKIQYFPLREPSVLYTVRNKANTRQMLTSLKMKTTCTVQTVSYMNPFGAKLLLTKTPGECLTVHEAENKMKHLPEYSSGRSVQWRVMIRYVGEWGCQCFYDTLKMIWAVIQVLVTDTRY